MTTRTILLITLGGALVLPCLADDQLYVVKKSDTLSAIARKHHLTTKSLAQWNSLKDDKELAAGSKLLIPDGNSRLVKYIVQKGDSLANIAYEHGQSATRVARLSTPPPPLARSPAFRLAGCST